MLIKKFSGLLIILLTLAIIGCSESPTVVKNDQNPIQSIQEPCGQAIDYLLYAGKTTLVGKVTLSNDETNLYIEYTFNAPYVAAPGEMHVWFGATAPTERGAPGQYPYHSTNTGYVSYYAFVIPLTEVQNYWDPVTQSFYFMTHASVWTAPPPGGNYTEAGTAFSEDIQTPRKQSWFGYNSFTWQTCGGGGGGQGEEEWYICEGATAWGGHLDYPGNSWSKYIEYSGTSITEDLWAGQFTNIGSVTVTTNSGGFVVISYNVTLPDWSIYVYHAGVYSTVSGIPHSPGGIIPGQLSYSQSYYNTSINPPVYVKADEQTSVSVTTTYQYTSGTVYIAAHAGVHRWCLVQ